MYNNKFKNMNFQNQISLDVETLKILKKLVPKVKKLNLKLDIGTENVILTSCIVGVIASAIGIILPHVSNSKDIKYEISPIYENGNKYHIEIDSILELKIAHIIYVIASLVKKGMIKNERTSNRKAYAYGNEFN